MAKADNIAFVGGGIMAEALIAGIIGDGLIDPKHVSVGEPDESRRKYLDSTYGISCESENLRALHDVGLIVLSIKPQHLGGVLAELRGHINKDQLVLSIVAGASISQIQRDLDHPLIVRVMPNTPSQVRQGMIVWTASRDVSEMQKAFVLRILETLGLQVFVEEERYLDMATAISASGPAYVFLFLEAMIDAGVYLGLSKSLAETLVLQTFSGSTYLAKESDRHLAELRNMVTSPGGTTAEALLSMERDGIRAAIVNAVVAAHRKAGSLGD